MKPLLDACALSGNRVTPFSDARPYVSTGDVSEHVVSPSARVTFDNRPSRADLVAKKGDVLFARMQATDKVVLVTEERSTYIWSTGFAALRPTPEISSRWVEYWLKSSIFQERKDALCTGATQKAITNDALRELSIPIPPISEQLRLVQTLDEADQFRRLRTKSDRRTADLIPALFHEMFGDPLTNPKCWEWTTVGKLSSFITSGSRGWAEHYSDRGAQFIRVQNLARHQLCLSDIAHIKPPDTVEAKRTRVQQNDLLLAITGNTIGLSALVPLNIEEAYVSQHVAIIRLERTVSPVFAACFMALPSGGQYHIAAMQYGHTKPGISLQQIRDIPVPLPPLPMQEIFAERVAEVHLMQAEQETSRLRLDNLFQSILHRAFQGDL